MRLRVRHLTRYVYSLPVSRSVNRLCLLPRATSRQRPLSARLDIEPEPDLVDEGHDAYGNRVARFGIDVPHERCTVTVHSIVETRDAPPTAPPSLGIAENRAALAARGDEDALMAEDCLLPSPWIAASTAIDALIDECPPEGRGVVDYAEALGAHIHASFRYDPAFSTVVTPIAEVIEARRGVCQDFAHLAIAALRRVGIPARYVSGYLETLPPPGQAKLLGADASHAWYAVFDARAGWLDYDPTNDKRPDAQYVTTAWGRDYGDVTPLKGIVYGGGQHELGVEVDVDRIGASVLGTEG